MTKQLYVGNLPYTTDDADLARLVSQYGEVISAHVPTDRETGRARGFGFVEVADAAAEAVIRALHGSTFGGRTLTVNEARPREDRPHSDRYDQRGRGRS